MTWLDDLRDLMPELGPGVFVAEVQHDSWCPLPDGNGVCTCNPDITVRRFGGQEDAPRETRPEVSNGHPQT